MNDRINRIMLRLSRRAESADRERLLGSFVDAGTLLALLESRDHQLIYGRRGTGKTHALLYLNESLSQRGELPVYVDMRTIGSTGGLYADQSLPLAERATRLLQDTLLALHDSLLESCVANDERLDLSAVGPLLDQLADACTEVAVTGQVEKELEASAEHSSSATSEARVTIGGPPALGVGVGTKEAAGTFGRVRTVTSGEERHRVHFGAVGRALNGICKALAPMRIWLLIDEWSVVPLDLQPYLADLLRRSVLPAPGITVKACAIDHRTQLQLPGPTGDYVGIELGADVTADLSLDDFMVFENNAEAAISFFKELLFRHFRAVVTPEDGEDLPSTADEFVAAAFTQRPAFDELVKAAEGVPRDAINIMALCAQKAGASAISMPNVRAAARTWYQRDKEAAASANPKARALLDWIVDEVISHRKARAFLLSSGVRYPLIDALFDARVLHVLKRSISAQDEPGIRYDAYKIDYGCYVDLLTTGKAPQGLFALDEAEETTAYVEVPPDDYRAIRRAILRPDIFESKDRGAAR